MFFPADHIYQGSIALADPMVEIVAKLGFLTIEFLDRTINGVHITQNRRGMQSATTWRSLALLPLCLCIGLELRSICNVVHVLLVTHPKAGEEPLCRIVERLPTSWGGVVIDPLHNFIPIVVRQLHRQTLC